MAEISKISTHGTEYDIKDAKARPLAEDADYYAHWNFRVQQITEKAKREGRCIDYLDLNETLHVDDFEGGRYCHDDCEVCGGLDACMIIHPKEKGLFSLNSGMGPVPYYILVPKGITNLEANAAYVCEIDLSLFTGDTPLPTIEESHDGIVYVPKGRKEELLSMTNWCYYVENANEGAVEEVETW